MLPYIPFRKPHSLLCLFSIHFCSIKKNDLYQLCPCEDPFYELSGHLSENPVVVGQLTIITCGANTYSLCWCWYWAHQVGQPFRWQCGAPALDSRAKLREDALMGTNYKARRASWAKSCYKGKASSKPAVSTSDIGETKWKRGVVTSARSDWASTLKKKRWIAFR